MDDENRMEVFCPLINNDCKEVKCAFYIGGDLWCAIAYMGKHAGIQTGHTWWKENNRFKSDQFPELD